MSDAVAVALIVASGPTVLALVVAGLQERAARIRVERRNAELELLEHRVDDVVAELDNGTQAAADARTGPHRATWHPIDPPT